MAKTSSTLYFIAIVFCACVGIRGTCTSIVLQELCLVVLGPYPDNDTDDIFQPDWDGGPALIPAVRLAVDKINNRTDILSGYRLRLLEGDSGCDIKSKTAVSLVRNVFRSTRSAGCPVVGIVGPGCTGAATFIGTIVARNNTSLLQISPSATSPLLTNSSTYPNTFRVLSSSLEYVSVYIELIKHNGWDTVAALYDADRQYFLSTFKHFRDVMESISNIGYSSPVSDNEIPLSDIYAEYRVVFAFVGGSLARKLLCLAYHFQPSLIYPAHQWIFHDRTEEQLLQNVSFSLGGTHYNCSEQQMIVATKGVILNVYRFKRDNVDTKTDVDLTLYNFYESYEDYLSEHLSELDPTRNQYSQTAEDYAPVYYDATWAMALSLNRSASDLARLENITLSDYSYGIPQATAIIKHHLSELQFEGISGRIIFRNETRDSATIIDIYQLKDAHPVNSSSVLIGYYNGSELNMSDSAEFISDSFDMVIVTAHPAFTIVFSIIVIVTTGCVMALQFLYVRHRNSSFIKASSPHLSHLIFSGCYLLLVLAFMIVIISSKWLAVVFDHQSRHYLIVQGVVCNVGGLCNNIGLTLIVGTLCVQQWRLYRIFNRFQVKHYFLSNKYLVCFVVCLVVFNLTVMGVWISTDPQLPIIQMKDVSYSPDGLEQPVIPIDISCHSKRVTWYGLISTGINVVVSLCLVTLSILNRHIQKKEFNTASGVNVYVYVTTPMTALVSTMGFLFQERNINVQYVLLLWELSSLVVVFIVCVFLFLPRIKPIIAETLCCRATGYRIKVTLYINRVLGNDRNVLHLYSNNYML